MLIDDNGHIRHPNVDDVIREIKAATEWRTRYEGRPPRADEMLVAEIDRLRCLIKELTDPDPCRYDHNGYCQTHCLYERPCPHERAKETEP